MPGWLGCRRYAAINGICSSAMCLSVVVNVQSEPPLPNKEWVPLRDPFLLLLPSLRGAKQRSNLEEIATSACGLLVTTSRLSGVSREGHPAPAARKTECPVLCPFFCLLIPHLMSIVPQKAAIGLGRLLNDKKRPIAGRNCVLGLRRDISPNVFSGDQAMTGRA